MEGSKANRHAALQGGEGGQNFVKKCVTAERSLTDQESCVINGGSTTSYFKLEKGARQGDPSSAYLFIIALEITFAMIKSNPNIKGLNIFNSNYLYTAYADDTTFF